MKKHTAHKTKPTKLYLLLELFPKSPGPTSFHRGGSVKGVFESREEAEALVAQDADSVADGMRFFLCEVAAEELL